MPYRETEVEKVYFTIGEVAEVVHQATSALRVWEREFPFLSPKLNKAGHRQYNREDLQIVIDVNLLLKGMGMTLEGVRQAYEFKYVEDIKKIYKAKIRKQK